MIAHCDDGYDVRALAADGVHRGLGDHEGAEVDDVGVHRRGHADGAGAGGLHQALARDAGLRDFVGRVAEVEAVGPCAAHLPHQQVANASAVQLQSFLHLSHQRNLSRAPVEGNGRGGEGPEHVDDYRGSGGLPRVPHQAPHAYFHTGPFVRRGGRRVLWG